MLEKKISCNGSTAATTLINLNTNVSKTNCNATTSSGVSNSNNKSSTSSAGGTAVETSASKPIDVMAIKTEDISLRNTCKTEIDSEKADPTNVSNSNGPPVSTVPICDTPASTTSNTSVQNTSSGASASASNVNGKNKNSKEKSKNPSPEVSPQSRDIKNEGGIQQPVTFVENQTEGITKISKDSVAGNKGTVTPASCTGAIKSEVIPTTGGNPSPACVRPVPPCPQNIGPPGLPGPPNVGPTPSISIQPLPSNMVNKSSTSIESQYMQQQSQIFVFSTGLANKAAEAVLSEHYPSIIAFHCAQPGTVRFLEKHPLKVQQFHRQSSAMWLNNLAQMKQGNRQMKLGPMNPIQSSLVHHPFPGGPCGQCHGPCNQPAHGPRMSMGGPRGPVHQGICHSPHPDFGLGHRNNWNLPMNGANMNCDPRFQNQQGNRPMFHHGMGPHCSDQIGGEYPCNSDNMGPCTSMDSSKLNSVKVPDENLTPEQRQHRKEQLVILRNLGQLLLPDLHNPGASEPQNSQSPMVANSLRLGHPQGLVPHCHNELCNHPGMHPLQHQGCGNDVEGVKHPSSPSVMSNFAQQKVMLGPNCSSGDHSDWQRSNNFYDEANSKCAPSLSQSPQAMNQNQPPHLSHHPITPQSGIKQQPSLNSSSPTVGASPNSTVRVQGPPPPYHQGSRCPVVSPHPASPSTVSLSSPHMASGLPSPVDPSRSFPHPPTSTNRLSHPSPGGGSLHSTPLSSPKPSNPPNAGALPKSSSTPIPTPTSMQTNSSLNNLVPSPGSAVSTTASVTNRKRATTPGSVTQQSVDMEYGPLSQPLTPSSDGMMFGSNRSLHLCGQSPRATPKPADLIGGHPCPGKEPSLMPVPSPQQIQYLNAFEGQELTIQKQPNTSLRETELLSQNVPPNGAEGISPNFPPFPRADMARNSFGNMPGPGMGPGPCSSSLCSCGESSHPRFQQMQNNGENIARMYPGQHPGMQQLEGPMQRFRGGVPNNMNFHNQVPGVMPRFATAGPAGMDHHRYRGPHIQNEMGPSRYPTNFGGPQRMDGMMIRNQFIPGNGNTEPVLHRQYSSPGPTMPMFDGHPPHPHNMPNLQKSAIPFENMKTASPLGSGIAGDDSSSSMGLAGGSQRLSHFDPIASMTAMSDSALASPGLNRNQNPNSPVMNVPNLHLGNSPLGCNQGPPMNYNPNAQSMHVNQSSNNSMMHGQQGMPFGGVGQHGQNLSPAPRQNVNNSFLNATMSIQQLNIQNATSNYSHRQSISPSPGIMQMQQVSGPGPGMMSGGNTISSQATSNHPIMHSGIATKAGGTRGGSSLQQFPGSPVGVPKRGSSPLPQGNSSMLPRNPGAVGSPGYLSPNVHVKASAPNTIQYLPARPQNCSSVSNRPPSLDFLQRYASPLTNLDSKVPTHNLQYFPSVGPNNGSNGMQLPSPGGDSGLALPGHDLDGQTRSMGQINRNHTNFIGGPPTPNPMGQPMSAASPMLNDPNDFNRTTGMPMGNNGPNMNNTMVNMGSVNNPLGIFHSNKNLPLSPSGLAPDTTQPLPSSMGQTLNYKQSPFYGPTTADPNYAVQFHNFQQQLYATNTRGNQGNNPNVSTNPSFFNLK